jgi:signal transduction histidine kinase
MQPQLRRIGPAVASTASVAVLVVLLTYIGAYFNAPDPGFRFDTGGQVTEVTGAAAGPATLQRGDQVLSVAEVTWEDYKARRRPFLAGARPGQVVPIRVERAGQVVDVLWVVPALTPGVLAGRLFNVWWVACAFWLAGIRGLLGVRPRDERWALFLAFCFLTAVWLVAGTVSTYRLLGSASVLRAGLWLSIPVYLHLHWVFPSPLGRLPRLALAAGYLTALGLALADWVLWLPPDAYLLAFCAAIFGSLALLLVRYRLRPADRRDLRLLLAGAGLMAVLAAGLAVAGLFGGLNASVASLVFGLPILPFTYLYVIRRRRLGGLELRVNRAISFYIFLVLLLPLAAVLLAASALAGLSRAIAGGAIAALTAVLTLFGFPPFQRWVERRLLGVAHPPEKLLEAYAEHAAAASSPPALAALLRRAVLQPFLIRQSALIQVDRLGHLAVLDSEQVAPAELPAPAEVPALLAAASRYRPAEDAGAVPCPWARLVLPLRVGDDLTGLWLLGRRPPDDYYALGEVQALRAVAHQTALALSHLAAVERVRRLYAGDISQREAERSRLARELHDSVLADLAALLSQAGTPPPLVARLRAIVVDIRTLVRALRPARLEYGLAYALALLADELADSHPGDLEVRLDVSPNLERYPSEVEQHLYRVVQQACDNAREHARARVVRLAGELLPDQVELVVEDDGVGFSLDPALSLDQHLSALVHAGHYGLAGMFERANLIGAALTLDTAPGRGTRVRLTWRPPPAP